METKSYEVFYSVGTYCYKTPKVYKGIGAAKRAATALVKGASHVMIVGYDAMAHRNFELLLK